jgi:hypothetical protein
LTEAKLLGVVLKLKYYKLKFLCVEKTREKIFKNR